ncbi:GNAT family N-acetyltransferase [Bacillus sp. FJAT-49736]|uniref:GNAT family N-acetyltransferase n=1 Tax=Bacillus sp. FJAT-49736 TaxID=2833582 RepID=UPI001BCA2741|nr:GNAT family N-acetyltransferase [Bacillus sp. FJAT-49736]MBS4175556.1 GNAT family N-acetyltransferase [Bacillus sp. FJAT-49736]
MKKIVLVPHLEEYAKKMSSLSSMPEVKDALGLSDEQTSVAGTIDFIRYIQEEERLGKQYSRVIMNEEEKLVGVITLKELDFDNKTCHIGTWIGYPYWGKGYNQLAKAEMLNIAFRDLNLDYVFAGARKINLRSQQAQIKLPYMSIGVEEEFPEEHQKLERQEGMPCVLNVVRKEQFVEWYVRFCS